MAVLVDALIFVDEAMVMGRRVRPSRRADMLSVGMGALLMVAQMAMADPVRVERTAEGARLLVNGKPFYIKGAGGSASKEKLAQAGGNAFRTWGVGEDTQATLDEAHRLGLKVLLGIWLGHERHGFDYNDPQQVRQQFEAARAAVLRYKDHPALLAWGVGNEMEGFGQGDNPKIWAAVNDIAKMIHELDPHHPTVSTVAEVGGQRVKALHEWCPDIDIVGINSYGGVRSLPQRYRAAGGTKPYVVTEYGPPGTWEVGRNAWGVPEELTSTQKAEIYSAAYQALAADPLCLGSFAFTWGSKQEATATWFSLFLPNGVKLAGVDALTACWTGRPPDNLCPVIRRFELVGEPIVEPGAVVKVALDAADPEGAPLRVEWVLYREMEEFETGGDDRPAPPTFPEAIVSSDHKGAELRMPAQSGHYRLFAYAYDDKDGGAAANLPLMVDSQAPKIRGKPAHLPLAIYSDDMPGAAYIPSGYMGDINAIHLDEKCADSPWKGPTCLKINFTLSSGWGGVVWQDPPNDWGQQPGGYDLTGAQTLRFNARGERGGEKVKFGFGLLGRDTPFFDTAKGEIEVTLSSDWTEYQIDLKGKNLERIKSGFYWVLGGQGQPVTFFLDEVRYE